MRELDLAALLAVLRTHDVDFVLIGGIAAVAHGSPFPTEDVDITPLSTKDNLERLSGALTELDAISAPRRTRTDCRSRTTLRHWLPQEPVTSQHDLATLISQSLPPGRRVTTTCAETPSRSLSSAPPF